MLEKSREGFKYGDVTLRDHMAYDGLHDIFTDQAMGLLTEQVNQQDSAHITREEQDAFAAASHQNAARAWKDGLFDNEVVPVSIPQRKASRSSSRRTKASAPTPPPNRSASCVPRSARTAPSPPAPPPRSPTAPPP
ncbi:hypothetical protein GCM10020255_093030 [Rhodococcus baikonurensis]